MNQFVEFSPEIVHEPDMTMEFEQTNSPDEIPHDTSVAGGISTADAVLEIPKIIVKARTNAFFIRPLNQLK